MAVGHFLRCIVYEMIMCCETKVIWAQFIRYMLELRAAGAMPDPQTLDSFKMKDSLE